MRRILLILGLTVFSLLILGFAVLVSASGNNSMRLYGNIYTLINRQAMSLGIALVLALAVTFFDYHRWRDHPYLVAVLWVAVVVMLFALIPPVARKLGIRAVNGSFRWLKFGPLRIQPTELAKIVTILTLGVWMDRIGWRIWRFVKGVGPMALTVGVFIALALAEPDLGSAVVIGALASVLFLIGGVKLTHLGAFALVAMTGVAAVLFTNQNRLIRLAAHLSPERRVEFVRFFKLPPSAMADKDDGAGYQLNQSLVAFGNAYRQDKLYPFWDPGHYHPWWNALTGVGYNESMQKRAYLPEAHTDFIFAIGAEELGLAFSLTVLGLFGIFMVCGFAIAGRAEDRLGRIFAYGATFLVGSQAVANIGVVTGRLPTKGLALPFLSYGGTNLISTMVCVALLFNVGMKIGLQNDRRKSRLLPVFSNQEDENNV